MKKLKFLAGSILLLFLLPVHAQDAQINELNNYKYIIVPIQYDFLQEDNEFLLSSLTKHLFKQEGYTVLIDNEKPPKDLVWNPCLALKVNLIGDYKNMFSFSTDLKFKLMDCEKNVVYESVTGSSREKDFKEAYHEALREAFLPLKSFYYSFNPNNVTNNRPKKNKPLKKTDLFETVSHYSLSSKTYSLNKIEAGYLLKDAKGHKEAFINQTSNGSILYNSERLNGTLIILENGDLQVEYFNKETGKIEQALFKKEDQ